MLRFVARASGGVARTCVDNARGLPIARAQARWWTTRSTVASSASHKPKEQDPAEHAAKLAKLPSAAELDAAWEDEAAKLTIAQPPPGVRPASAVTVIDGKEVTDQERRERTREFIEAVSDPSQTTRQLARDMIFAAVKTHGTLRPHHLERIIARAPAASPFDRHLMRAFTVVIAALDAADEAGLALSEYAANDNVLNLLLFRVASACNAIISAKNPGVGPDELMEIVGQQFIHEPQWWLAARMEARGVPITHPRTLEMLEASASRQKQIFGMSKALRANRAEFVERQRRYALEQAIGEAERQAAGAQRAQRQPMDREPAMRPAGSSD